MRFFILIDRIKAPSTGSTRYFFMTDSTLKNSIKEFRRGVKLGFPILLGYFPVGIAFGILAAQYGFSPLLATLCSATALAGAGQFIALSVLIATQSISATLIASAVVNLRYILFAAALSPYLSKINIPKLSFLAFTLTDESFAVNISDLKKKKAGFASMSGVGIISWFGWVAGTLVGSLSANYIGDPNRFGVDFAMAAMFSALLIALAENRQHIIAAAVAVLIVLGLAYMNASGLVSISPNNFILIASLGAALIASIIFKRDTGSIDEVEIPLVSEEESTLG